MFESLKKRLAREWLIFKQNSGIKTFTLTPEQIQNEASQVYGFFREPQPVYNDNGEMVGASYVYEPKMYPDNKDRELKLRYLEGMFFTLDGYPIWNMAYFEEHGKDEPTYRRILRYNYGKILRLVKVLLIPILIGTIIFLLTKGGK